jgi:UDP-N-acetylmuramate: L-alanyl-gamma-D-glutamyl-meso-diaminopimelate ligase
MNLNYKRIHFIGICGTLMGSAAVMLKHQGYEVTGSDTNVYPPMSTFLENNKVIIYSGYSSENIDQAKPDLVIVGNAISRGNPELERVLNDRIRYTSLPDALKTFFLWGNHNIVITGTHGKTTTTAITAWIFQSAGRKPSYMIGGVPNNFTQGCEKQDGPYWIIEGDEYDTCFFDKRSKFLHYLPELLVINNLEFDHADIFDSLEDIKRSFINLFYTIPQNGMVLANADEANVLEVLDRGQAKGAKPQILTIGLNENAAARITNIQQNMNGTTFDFLGHTFETQMHGVHNVRNCAMAIASAHFYQIPFADIQKGLKSFEGVKRRLEVRGEVNGITIIDDFAHHPTAIRETIFAARAKYPQRKIWTIFEPRSATSRRAVFQKELPEALKESDGVLLAQVANADKIKADERLNVSKVIEDLLGLGKKESFLKNSADEIVEELASRTKSTDVVLVLSNGGFDGIHAKILDRLKK